MGIKELEKFSKDEYGLQLIAIVLSNRRIALGRLEFLELKPRQLNRLIGVPEIRAFLEQNYAAYAKKKPYNDCMRHLEALEEIEYELRQRGELK
jgi:hypothetical protein